MTAHNSDDDPLDLDRIDQEIRINELKHRAEELAGGQMTSFEAEEAPPGLVESFWQHVVDFESAPDTSQYEILTRAGIEMPPAEPLDDEALTAKLWEIIHALAARNTYLERTDHLSNRELYKHLVEDSFHEITKDFSYPGMNCHIDILGGCSDEDLQLNLRYYADEEERARWAADFPEDVIPPKEPLPYDRDRHFPKARYE